MPQLEKMGYNFWPLTTHTENIDETGKILNKKLVYLSPDAELPLEKIESGTNNNTQTLHTSSEDSLTEQ